MDKETPPTVNDNDRDESTWAHDQQKRDYYYDDSHGYEIYNPDEDEDKDEPEANNLTEKVGNTL